MYNIPKSYLAKLIIDNIDNNSIRRYFSIKEDTDIYTRICSLSIAILDEFIYKQDEHFIKLMESFSEEFPLRTSPTLYILNKSNIIDTKSIEEKSINFSKNGRLEALEFPDTRAVRAIYTRQPLKLLEKNNVYELALGYEKKIEIIECDPTSESFSEAKKVYSLENALVWYPKINSSYAIIACCDFSAVSSLILYLNLKYNIQASLPDLTETMLDNLSEGSSVRNATFGLELSNKDENIDVKTITIYDQKLSESKIYLQMREQMGRIQRSGFYSDHPNLLRAGIGISCKYGRIWTPAHLNRNELVTLAVGSINKLDLQLKNVAEYSLKDFFIYYSNKEVSIDGLKLSGISRKLFDRLVYYLAVSEKNGNSEIEIDPNFQKELAINYKKLRLASYVMGDCPNCGEIDFQCPNCGKMLDFSFNTDEPILKCRNCDLIIDSSELKCTCGEECPVISVYSSIEYLPSLELLKAISEYAAGLHPVIAFPAIFKIKGNKLLTLNQNKNPNAKRVNFDELKYWKIRAHIDTITAITPCAKEYIRKAHEKCNINNYHPSKIDCQKCAKKAIKKSDFESNNICLLRTFGIPINEKLDGIHHGHEKADILYTDEFDGKQHKIGIHVKKHAKNTPPKGLGRSEDKIKGLYAQVYYTLFELRCGKTNIDTIGIAIPNRVSEDIINSIQALVLYMGYSFIALQIDDWEKIAQAAIDTVEFEK